MKISVILTLGAMVIPKLVLSQVYDDTQIRTLLVNTGGWDMTDLGSPRGIDVQSVQGMGVDKFVGVETMVYSNSAAEAFNLTRLSGLNTYRNGPCRFRWRSGGWGEIFRYAPGASANTLNIHLLSGEWDRTGNPDCPDTFPGNFFAASFPYMQQALPSIGRSFAGMTGNRATVKFDYVCTSNCPPNAVNSLWIKLQAWDMATFPSKTINLSSYGVSPSRVVDMAASIISDPGTTRQVDDLEHLGVQNNQPYPVARGRGGILWYGYGCFSQECWGESSTALRVRLYAGSGNGPYFSDIKSSYRGSEYLPTIGNPMQIGYTDRTSNRGWLKIDYMGSATTVAVPYAMRSKVLPIGPWNMSANLSASIPLTNGNFNVSTDRIAGVNTTIQSDNVGTGWHITNFHRPTTKSGTNGSGDEMRRGGGLTYVEDRNIRLALSKRGNVDPGYYDWYHSQTQNSDGTPINRGWVRLDYLAGSCEQGPSGFKIRAIPGSQVGDCAGSASTFTLDGAGEDIWGSADDFAYVYKSGSGDMSIEVKLESQEAVDAWAKSGLMIRETLNSNSRHVSMLTTPIMGNGARNGVDLHWRDGTGATTGRTLTSNTLAAPLYLRLTKSGNVFTAATKINANDAWADFATHTVSGFASTYYYGLAQSSHGPKIGKSTFSNFSVGTPPSGTAGLFYGTVSGNINTTSPNPMVSVTTTLSETENSIAGNTTEIFSGAIYDADGDISFSEDIDDKARLYIDGNLVLSSDNWSDRTSTGNLNLSPGWHTFELRISNGSGGSGPHSSPGFGYDPNGGTNWVHPSDPGNGSLFRTTLPAVSGPQTGVPYSVRYVHSQKCLGVVNAGTSNGANIEQQSCTGASHQKLTLNQEPGGFYSLRFQHSNQMVDINGANTANGASALQWPYHGNDNQLFSLIDHGNGTYSFRYKHSQRCVDVNGAQTTDGANVIQWDCHFNSNQRFTFE